MPARAFYARRGLVELERTDGSGNEEKAPDVTDGLARADPVAFFRGLIDEVDDALADLLARRAALTRAVQDTRATRARDPDREREIAERMARAAPELGADRLSRIVHAIITASLDAVTPEREWRCGGLVRTLEPTLTRRIRDQPSRTASHGPAGPRTGLSVRPARLASAVA